MYALAVYIVAGGITVQAVAFGPWATKDECEQAAATTRAYARIWVREIKTECTLDKRPVLGQDQTRATLREIK